ncbi:porin [Pseudogulbenkiania sp. MAI-1]|uniref:porin n=1 Tax=Pseudogulbenkiania sp. MAI-1 TaxID=990370 RepID=UPI00045E9654|nr:porin [Pseudogulbenkiania sp. MAI-1]
MKKLSIAVAVALALPLSAHALDFQVGSNTQLSISGLLAVGQKWSKVEDNGRGTKNEQRLDDNTSRLIFSGSTDLGNGLKAIGRIESRLTTDTRPSDALTEGQSPVTTRVGDATGWADGDTWFGLAGQWGQATFGKSTLYYTDTMAVPNFGLNGAGESYRTWDVQSLATFNLLSEVANGTTRYYTTGITRSRNVLRYDSPKFGGLDGSIAYTKNAAGDEQHCAATATSCAADYTAGGTWYGRLRYNDGPLTASLSLLDQKPQGSTLDTRGYRLGAGYTLPFNLKLGLVYDNTTVKNGVSTGKDAKRGVWMLPVSYGFGDHMAYLTYTKAGNTSNVANSGASQLTVGYDYALAKNAFAGVFLTKLKNDSNGTYVPYLSGTALGSSSPAKGEGWHQLSFNVNYWF